MYVTPKPASTVVLIDNETKVFLTKRPATMKFLAGHYVFPGGSLDKSDYPVITGQLINMNDSYQFSPAHYVAAARELFEEVGVNLATKEDGSPCQMETANMNEYRRLLLDGKITFFDIMSDHQLILDCNKFKYMGHKITPESSPYRFDTRFFIAQLPEGQNPMPDVYEIEEAFWITPEAALAAYKEGKLKMIKPTVLALNALVKIRQGKPID
ncbi:NUDIX hydrolase [Cytobacillus purgationiresistens]|uniref:8-oxo-dGTP pyrophosphatase MutT (NUDIX family) n=1 Tax=Cytobacillus purgationiresistens TaxID=863449 RepID=A0ABU0AFM5_9BACI|nr:NUDIX hydrolase [Cytobacillus purgationiresistens]MDQ0269659.1 8-oxo-dGTP pyrophosphatase MutT (NUDIX family) [Cytobacillus purgationiresistens]